MKTTEVKIDGRTLNIGPKHRHSATSIQLAGQTEVFATGEQLVQILRRKNGWISNKRPNGAIRPYRRNSNG